MKQSSSPKFLFNRGVQRPFTGGLLLCLLMLGLAAVNLFGDMAAAQEQQPKWEKVLHKKGLTPRTSAIGARNAVPSAPTALYTVNSLADTNTGAGTAGTLRYCLTQANAAFGGSAINFSVTGTINLTGALPGINSNMTINGPGPANLTVRRDTGGKYRIFTIGSGKTVGITGLTITKGHPDGEALLLKDGGGIQVGDSLLTVDNCVITGNTATGVSGGIDVNGGTLTLLNSTVSGNMALGISAVGVYFNGNLNIINSTISGNSTISAALGTENCAVYGDVTNVTLTNSTFSGNTTPGAGAIQLASTTAMAMMNNCTVTNNVGMSSFGIGINSEATVKLRNTLVADNTGPNFLSTSPGATVISLGNNLDSDGTSGFANGVNGDIVGTSTNKIDARLAPLGDYGGLTKTHALRFDSPALDAGGSPDELATDQRGLLRNADGDGNDTRVVDIGAFETQNNLVANTNDNGAGSLRQAILDNNAAGFGLISFNIPGGGVKTILPVTNLPLISRPVKLDGYTQPGASPNSLPAGSNAMLKIELSGASAGEADGLILDAGNSIIRGLIINQWSHIGLGIYGLTAPVSDNQILGNFIGTDFSGTAARGNSYGLVIGPGSSGNTVGDGGAGRNTISGNSQINALLDGETCAGNTILSNYIGSDAAGANSLPNPGVGIRLQAGTNGNQLLGNLIVGHSGAGITLSNTTLNTLASNFIGVAPDGATGRPNGSGITITNGSTQNIISGGSGSENVIAFNNGPGIWASTAGNQNPMLNNKIYSNAGLGIDLGELGVTANDAADADAGPNKLQNFPVLNVSATSGTITGSIDSAANNAAYPIKIDFYANAACNSSGHGEGDVYIGQKNIVAPGDFTFTFTPVPGKNYIAAVATDSLLNTSEFSNCQPNGCPAIAIAPATLPAGIAGALYDTTFTQTGGTDTVSFTISLGAAPAGLTLSTSGVLSGTPTAFGDFSFTVKATDGSGCMGERAYTLAIAEPCGTLTISPATLPNGVAGASYNAALSGGGGAAPYGFTVSAGTLPDGLTLSAAGVLAGSPAAAGTFNFTVKTADAKNCEGTRGYTVTIDPSVVNNGLQFYPLPAPVRLLDTRPGQTGCAAPGAPIPGGTSRTQAGRAFCGIPASAKAITGNITTVQSGGGYLTLYPGDAAQPLVANSNYNANEILNNVFTVGLGNTDGAFKIFVTSDTHVVVDITGYYAPPTQGGLYFHPLPKPIRLLETRAGFTGCTAPGAPLPGDADTTQSAHLSCDGVTIPATAKAITGNATTVNPGGPGFPYLTLFPEDAARPLVASSNYLPGQIMNAPFTVGLSAAGKFKIYPATQTDLVIDVLGYYSADAADANGTGLLFNPLPKPVRLLETRAGFTGCFATGAPLQAGSTRTQPARGTCDGVEIAANALGLVGNATVVNSNGGYLTFWPGTAAQPTVATSNFNPGQVFNRHFTVGLGAGDGAFKIFTQFQTDLVIDVSGYFAP